MEAPNCPPTAEFAVCRVEVAQVGASYTSAQVTKSVGLVQAKQANGNIDDNETQPGLGLGLNT